MALAALIDFGKGIQEKLNELDRENIEALEKAKKAAKTESNAFSLFGWMKSKEVKEEEEEEKASKLFIEDLQEKIATTKDEETKHRFQAQLARYTKEESQSDTQYIKEMMDELKQFKEAADSSQKQPDVQQPEPNAGKMNFFTRAAIPKNGRSAPTKKKSNLAEDPKKKTKEGGRGKARKTKRSMSMGGNTKKRSKGGKRRTSKK